MSAGNDREFIDHQQEKERGRKMKCPLAWGEDYEDDGKITYLRGDCLKEECAWWDKNDNRCSILVINWELKSIACALADILDKIPHSGQFLQKP